MESSGQGQKVELLPIDIHYNKLLDWLINRRHSKQEWQKACLEIRAKISKALDDMPVVPEIKAILEGGTDINYFHCQKIIELLKETDSGKKNMFGQYSSQKMKDWVDVTKLYEKDGIYLVETAQMITRNVNYEIPALKKQIMKSQQVQKECDRKEADYVSKAAELRKKYDLTCKQTGIEGKKIKSELSALVADLPKTFNEIAESASDLQDAVEFYGEFVNFIMESQDHGDSCLHMLKYIQKRGNTTTYEWRTGTMPETVKEHTVFIDTTDEQDLTGSAQDIDWGDIGETPDTEEIDFSADIDFDISGITLEQGGTEENKNTNQSSELSITEPQGESNGIDWSNTVLVEHVERDGETSGVAEGVDAHSVLDNPVTRAKFMDDLMELEAFLTQRSSEMESGGNILSSSQFQFAPASIQHHERKTVINMVTQVKEILEKFSSVKMHHLMLIKNSPRYVDRLRDSLKQTLNLADKMVFYEKEMVIRRKEALEEQGELEPRLDILILKTKEMQKQMEKEISKKYKDRPVNIMGEINLL